MATLPLTVRAADFQAHDVVSVMREPIDWLGSWYRYRTRDARKDPAHRNSANYTGNVRFEEFVRAVILPRHEKPKRAMIKTPVPWRSRGATASASTGFLRMRTFPACTG